MKKYQTLFIFFIIAILHIPNYLNYQNTIPTISTTENDVSIDIIYPNYQYQVLNKGINKIIKEYYQMFNSDLENQNNLSSSYLQINYRKYEYNNYLSVVFYTTVYLGGAHPSHLIKTISYNKETNKIITIEDLINENKNILTILSNKSRNYFSKEQVFQDDIIKNMLYEGTKPQKENFQNFVFTPKGILFFFQRYQIAPYAYGDYNLTIPYQELNLSI